MTLPEYIKNQTNSFINCKSSLQMGVVTEVNDDGTYKVKIKGRDYSYQSVVCRLDRKESIKENDTVLVGFMDGDKQKPVIIQPPMYSVSRSRTDVEINPVPIIDYVFYDYIDPDKIVIPPVYPPEPNPTLLYKILPDGTGITKIKQSDIDNYFRVNLHKEKLVFQVNKDEPIYEQMLGVVNTDGSGFIEVPVGYDPFFPATKLYPINPYWSPDGGFIFFDHNSALFTSPTGYSILPSEPSIPRVIGYPNKFYNESDPINPYFITLYNMFSSVPKTINTQGILVAFIGPMEGRTYIFKMTPSGGNLEIVFDLTDWFNEFGDMKFNYEGTLLCFCAKPVLSTEYQIYTIKLDGTELTQISSFVFPEASFQFSLCFSRDGKYIYYDGLRKIEIETGDIEFITDGSRPCAFSYEQGSNIEVLNGKFNFIPFELPDDGSYQYQIPKEVRDQTNVIVDEPIVFYGEGNVAFTEDGKVYGTENPDEDIEYTNANIMGYINSSSQGKLQLPYYNDPLIETGKMLGQDFASTQIVTYNSVPTGDFFLGADQEYYREYLNLALTQSEIISFDDYIEVTFSWDLPVVVGDSMASAMFYCGRYQDSSLIIEHIPASSPYATWYSGSPIDFNTSQGIIGGKSDNVWFILNVIIGSDYQKGYIKFKYKPKDYHQFYGFGRGSKHFRGPWVVLWGGIYFMPLGGRNFLDAKGFRVGVPY